MAPDTVQPKLANKNIVLNTTKTDQQKYGSKYNQNWPTNMAPDTLIQYNQN